MTIKQHIEYDFMVSMFDEGVYFHFDRLENWDRLDLDTNENMYREGTIYAENGKEYGIEIRVWFSDTRWLNEEYEDIQDGIMDHIQSYVSRLIVPTDFFVRGYMQ